MGPLWVLAPAAPWVRTTRRERAEAAHHLGLAERHHAPGASEVVLRERRTTPRGKKESLAMCVNAQTQSRDCPILSSQVLPGFL